MKDKLEEFVRRNRDAFDDKAPTSNAWRAIESALVFSKERSLWNAVGLWRAAAVIFMALSVYLIYQDSHSPNQQTALKEFTDVERFYIQQISEKTELIEEFRQAEGLNGFTNDFRQLEAMYQVLREEMKNRPGQKVKDALVLNLLVRIDLLNQQLQKLENGEYQGKDSTKSEKAPGQRV